MRRKLIALISAVSMILTMSFANVASAAAIKDKGYTVVYDAVESTKNTAKIAIYLKGYSGEIQTLNFQLKLSENFDVESLVNPSSGIPSYATYQLSGKAQVNKNTSTLMLTAAGGGSSLSWNENEPLATFTLPIGTAVTSAIELKPTSAYVKTNAGETDRTVANDAYFDSVLPMSDTTTGTTIREDANSEAATYFSIDTTGVSGLIPYWYATVNGDAKKIKFTDANIEGPVTAGLVSTGSVSNAKVVWEVVEN